MNYIRYPGQRSLFSARARTSSLPAADLQPMFRLVPTVLYSVLSATLCLTQY
jgi:hypothetical protein